MAATAAPPPRAPSPAAGARFFGRLHAAVRATHPFQRTGRVTRVTGLVTESNGPAAVVGELCAIHPRTGGRPVAAEVVGFRDDAMLLMPIDEIDGIGPGCRVVATGQPLTVGVGPALLGRVLDGLGRPADGRGPIACAERRPVRAAPPPPMSRPRISDALPTRVRAIDAFLTLGRGQRVGIFSGSGIGKSVLVGQIARRAEADVIVIGLVGERGREVREFLDKNLGEEGLRRSVVVGVTSDDLALRRITGAYVATAIAEYFRDQGRDVLLLLDSITRFAHAQRELGLSIGEPPATRGYTPSVFATLPRLLERSGRAPRGSITGIYTILVEGDDLDEPIADTARSILDGHIVLSRELTDRGHYPGIDILQSLSRVMPDVAEPRHLEAAARLRRLYAVYRDSEDLIRLGAYERGNNPELDLALDLIEPLNDFLRQPVDHHTPFPETIERLVAQLAARIPRA